MRIHYWPALVCGWITAVMIGQTGLAADPAGKLSEAASLSDDFDDSDQDEGLMDPEDASGIPSAFQPMQYADGGASGGYPGGMPPDFSGGYAPEIPTNAWPTTSPFAQPRMSQVSNQTGLWQYDSDNNYNKKWILSFEYLYGHGLRPGNRLIGAPQFHNLDFFPGFPNVFPQQNFSNINNNVFHDGFKVKYGYENPDGSGFALSGFWLFENSLDNSRFLTHATPGIITTLTPLASIVLDNNDGTGQNVPFDSKFFTKFTQEIGGADADYYTSPIFERNSFKLRGVYGVKYLRIHEDFTVQAGDSGLGYIVDVTNDVILYPTVTFIGINPYTMLIRSSATSNLVGPEIGLRYDLGGDKFKIWGQSKFTVAANIERVSVSGQNVVQGFQVGATTSPSTLHTNNDVHVSPIFDTSINAEFPFFSLVPYINRMNLFKSANVRIGWNFAVVAETARAAGAIRYVYADPQIQNSRTWFEYNAFNFGVDWKW